MTSKDYLSQEEIDALLRQTHDDFPSDDAAYAPNVSDYLSSLEQDALGEIGNITFGSAATALSTLLGKKVDITTPQVSIIPKEELQNEFPQPHVAVHVNYVDGFQGVNLLVIKTTDAMVIADLMLGGDGTNTAEKLNEIHISAVQEAMNQMMGSSATSMSTIFNRFVNISPPGIDIMNLAQNEGVDSLPPEAVFIKVSFRLKIGDLIDSTLMQLLPVSFAKEMVAILMGGSSDTEAYVEEAAPASASEHAGETASYSPESAEQRYAQGQPVQNPYQYGQAPEQMGYQPPQMHQQPPMYQQHPLSQPPYQTPSSGGMPNGGMPDKGFAQPPQRNINVQPVQYTNFTAVPAMHGEETNLNLLLDIPLKVTVELGRTQKLIKDILELSQGSIIELDKLAGEPVDILVNNKLVAKGEVVVIDENFGVRVTDIVSQWDRIQKLQ